MKNTHQVYRTGSVAQDTEFIGLAGYWKTESTQDWPCPRTHQVHRTGQMIRRHRVLRTGHLPEHTRCSWMVMSKNTSVHKTGHVQEHTRCSGLMRCMNTQRVLRTGQVQNTHRVLRTGQVQNTHREGTGLSK